MFLMIIRNFFIKLIGVMKTIMALLEICPREIFKEVF